MKNLIGHYFIFQIKKDDEKAQECLFMNSRWHEEHDRPITVANYELVYGGTLMEGMEIDDIYYRFNAQRPKDFKGHSLSVSDVIVMVEGAEERCFFADDLGFTEIGRVFLDEWNYRDVELAFMIGDRYLCIQNSSEGGYDYDILCSQTEILDGGIYEDDGVSILAAANEIINSDLKREVIPFGKPGFNPLGAAIKGNVLATDDLIPMEYEDFSERECNSEFSGNPKQFYRNMILQNFRKKTEKCYNGKPVIYKPVTDEEVERFFSDPFNMETEMEGLTAEELEAEARAYVEEIFKDTGLTVTEVVLTGSRSRALDRSDSDCDFLVEYEGNMKEDGVFNILNHGRKEVYGVPFDFNPFREEESGSLVCHLSKADAYLEQKANTYFAVYWQTKDNPEETRMAYCRAYDKEDALKFVARALNFDRIEITDVVPAPKHQITRQSIVFNCADIYRELENSAVF